MPSAIEEEEAFLILSSLCREPFWNGTKSWASEEPELGICAERTLLVWAPCLLLWACAPPYLLYLLRRPFDPIPWTRLSCFKMAATGILLATAATELGWALARGAREVPPADFIAPVVLLMTHVIHMSLVLVGRRKGEQNSGIIWLFWLFFLFCGLPQLYTSIAAAIRKTDAPPPVLVATFLVQFLFCVALFLANCFSDAPSAVKRLSETENPSPLLQASFVNRLFFFWSGSIVWRGWRRPLTSEDLWDLVPENTTSTLGAQWEAATRIKSWPTKEKDKHGEIQFTSLPSSESQTPILLSLWRMFGKPFILLGAIYLLAEGSRFVTPQVLSLVITFMADEKQPPWHGYLYAVSLFLSCIVSTLLRNKFYFKITVLSVRVRSVIMSAVYRKALSLSGAARRDSTLGEIVNLMAVDAQCVGDTIILLWSLFGAPAIFLITMVFLWGELGVSVLAGVAVLFLIVPLNSYLSNRMKSLLFAALKFRDQRVKMVSEIISGIKVLKLYAWEGSFASKVQEVRNEEIRLLKKVAFLKAFNSFIFNSSPCMVALASFTTYLLASPDNVLDAKKAFVSISLFDIMRLPIVMLPSTISQVIQAMVALKRVQNFISAEEVDPTAVSWDRSEAAAVIIRGGQFSWEGGEHQLTWRLEDINLEIGHKKLVAVVGSVGAGKSSLISALLGEMKKVEGKVVVNGRMAYVSQQAWLQNATLRENILWGQPFDETRYQKVVKACALQPDLDMLPGGDMTEIGEKGINLSGGQKQRVSLARAVYSDTDIVLLDDPLSAVDAHVGRFIFDNVIGPQGILRGKTRLLVTHSVTFLPCVDEVVVMRDGRVVERGSYPELVAKQGDFANFVLQHINDANDEEGEEELEELREQLEEVPGAKSLLRQLSIRSSRTTVSNPGSTAPTGSPHKRIRSVSESHSRNQNLVLKSSSSSLNIRGRDIADVISDISVYSHIFDEDVKASKNALHESRTSLHSSKSRRKSVEMEEMQSKTGGGEGTVKGQKLVIEETSETGKVSRKMYLVYASSMGVVLAVLPVIFVALGQASIAGSNIWLSHWSSPNAVNDPALNTTSTLNTTYNPSTNSALSNTSVFNTSALPYNTSVFSTTFVNNTYDHNTTSVFKTKSDSVNITSDDSSVSRGLFLTLYGAFGIAQAFFLFLGMLTLMLGCLRSSRVLHQRLLDSVVRLPMSFFDTNPSGRIINRFSKDINVLDNTFPDNLRNFVGCFMQVVATLIVIVAATPAAGLFVLPVMLLYYLVQVIYIASSRQLKRIESVSKSPIYSHFGETLQGVTVIRAYKRQEEFNEESQRKIEFSLKATYTNAAVNRWVSVILEMMGNAITFAAAIVGVAGRGYISSGVVGLSVTYAISVNLILNWVVRVASEVEANVVSVERINEYLENEREAAWTAPDTPASWPDEGRVSFRNYQTRYRPGLDLVLKGITCSFRPAEKVGIVGRTGAGKSSLTVALFRLIEASAGEIAIDRVNIADVGLHDLRGRVSIIPQDPVLFSGTLRLNLDPLDRCSDAEVWRALELAHLAPHVRAQPAGLLHPVDEEGANFSVGQRQLVCLARALLRNSRILVLDEATAAIDLETDDLIQATIRSQFAQCTVLTIAHRLNTIMDSDRVLVLDKGSVAEFDTPARLLANPHSVFYGMAKDAGLV
ncbi:multidrug resistance-associated protein 1-like [Penaeus monodon]|uniref:multidrug resistance-associated protein 1-like n=1 Tax=Penaeus monodon TaxID=6687 RepID=UPI0018A70544|nr:multidrug resistance-associated protein 1-like [Penaeus monodon]XP_037804337.1 multidrug resistance-associated protein 1-like [Penaeus monodon]XP_037804338.1 multidrug resistance-associated protein 1-like [Penaeus monodon]XP_037804339.1 multidrug resistance-associated protein 1-like [Penaeus monodon]XP_037804340.1 multidrug resistance-associated protein 1-like [Penaeus monodon]